MEKKPLFLRTIYHPCFYGHGSRREKIFCKVIKRFIAIVLAWINIVLLNFYAKAFSHTIFEKCDVKSVFLKFHRKFAVPRLLFGGRTRQEVGDLRQPPLANGEDLLRKWEAGCTACRTQGRGQCFASPELNDTGHCLFLHSFAAQFFCIQTGILQVCKQIIVLLANHLQYLINSISMVLQSSWCTPAAALSANYHVNRLLAANRVAYPTSRQRR